MLGAAIVPERDRVLGPAEAALEQRVLAVLIQIGEDRVALVARDADDVRGRRAPCGSSPDACAPPDARRGDRPAPLLLLHAKVYLFDRGRRRNRSGGVHEQRATIAEAFMSKEVAVELIKIIPSVAWLILGGVAFWLFYGPIRDKLLPRLSSFKGFGIEASFIKEILDDAAAKNLAGDEQSRSTVARRAERIAQIAAGARVLVVNDHPAVMRPTIDILNSMKMVVATAATTDDAITLLKGSSFDVVVSDIKRGENVNEGVLFLNRAVELGINRPTIFYIANYDPSRGTPPYAFAITNRIDEMLNYIFDVIERTRG
jgi:CheY-like chemotaxis protein